MIKRLLIILLLVITGAAGYAQLQPRPGGPGMRAARVQGLRIEFITRYLKLTPEEAPFWSVFYQYSDDLKSARNDQPEDVIAMEEKVLAIKKKYRTEFKKVLGSDERAMKVFTIDREFNNLLKTELQKRAQQRLNR